MTAPSASPPPIPALRSITSLPIEFATHQLAYSRPVHDWFHAATLKQRHTCCSELARHIGHLIRHQLSDDDAPHSGNRLTPAVFELPTSEEPTDNDRIPRGQLPDVLDTLAWWERHTLLLVTHAAHDRKLMLAQLGDQFAARETTGQERALQLLYRTYQNLPEPRDADIPPPPWIAAPATSHPAYWTGWALEGIIRHRWE